jgi:hypothetical protein
MHVKLIRSRPTPSDQHPVDFRAPARRPIIGLAAMALVALSAGCVKPGTLGEHVPRQLTEIGCISRCKEIQANCNADARFDYRRCQAGYSEAFRDYRWCLASAAERSECGYPWWPCAENLFGACTNRAAECESTCRTPIPPNPPDHPVGNPLPTPRP